MIKKYNKLDKLKNAKSICLIAHIDPDVDAICSLICFKRFLNEVFKKRKVDLFAEYDSLPNNYLPLLNGNKLNPTPVNYDCAFIIDCPNTDRIGKYYNLYKQAKIKGVIDHHATNNLNPEIRFVEIVSSCCEILYSIFKEYKYPLNKEISTYLYAGLINDTNNFSVGAITKTSFEIASACLKYINPVELYDYFFLNTTLKSRIFKALKMAKFSFHTSQKTNGIN